MNSRRPFLSSIPPHERRESKEPDGDTIFLVVVDHLILGMIRESWSFVPDFIQ